MTTQDEREAVRFLLKRLEENIDHADIMEALVSVAMLLDHAYARIERLES